MWGLKLLVCIGVDMFDMTIGRFLIPLPFAGEAIGCAVACALFGRQGLWYLVEAVDFTEQVDGFIPTATLIALTARKNE